MRDMQDGNISELLEKTSRTTLVVEVARAMCRAFALLLCLGVLALVVDAAFALNTWGLISVDLLFLGLIGVAAFYLVRQAWRNLYDPRRVARLVERRLNLQNSELINSVDFQLEPDETSSRELIKKSILNAEIMAGNLSYFDAVDFKRSIKAAAIASGLVAGLLVTYLITPRLFAMVLPRFLDPTGDHPPFTLLDFDVEISPEAIYHGQSAIISAKLSGPEVVTQANVVFVGDQERSPHEMYQNSAGAFLLPIDRVEHSRRFYIDTPKGRSRQFELTVLQVPFVEKVQIAYRFPDYTKWPATSHDLDGRGVQAIEGTAVTITAKSNLPLREGRFELFDDKADAGPGSAPLETVIMTPARDDVATVSGTLTLTSNARFRLTLTSVDGVDSIDRPQGKIVAAPDRSPKIAIVEPEPHVIAVEGWTVPVVVHAADDVGIERVVLFCGVNGWGPDPIPLDITAAQPTLAVAQHEFNLASLGARAGDVITYHASAYDNHPSGEHFADTETFVIQVISEEEFREYARQEYQMEELAKEFETLQKKIDELNAQREEILNDLEELQKKLDSGEELSIDERQRLEKLQKQLQDYSEQAARLVKEMKKRAEQTPLYDMEQPYLEMLQTLSRQMQQQADNADALKQAASEMQNQPGGAQPRASFKLAAEKFRKENQPFDDATQQQLDETEQDLEKMRLADNLVAQAERLRAVILQQRDLADRMAQFRDRQSLNADEQRRADRLAKEQELLQQELEESRDALKKAAEEAKESLPNMSSAAEKICEALGEMQAEADQQQAATSARSGDGKSAHQAAETAASKLEKLLSECGSPQSATESGDLDGCLKLPKPSLQQSLQQLSQGRKIPGLGQKGESGSGYAGSQARMAVYGPQMPSQGHSESTRSGRGRDAKGGGRGFESGFDNPLGVESLTPEGRAGERTGTGRMRGVPVGYRDQAEAYFKRIAEEK